MNNYYLKINVVYKNNKKYFRTCDLYKGNKKIKTYDRDITKEIHKLAKEHHIDIVNKKDGYIIDNIDFIDKYIGIPSKKVSHINPYAGMIATFTSLSLAALGISALDHKYNPKLYDTSITSEVDDEDLIDNSMVYYDTGSDNELENFDIGDSSASLVYNTIEEDSNKPHVIIFSDNDNNYEESTNESLILTSSENIEECTYYFENTDHSNDKCVKIIDLVYGDDIKPIATNYGFSYDFILGDICQENNGFAVRYSTQGGVGPMQVEYYIWNGQSLPDIDGTNYTFDCSKLNNISNDFEKMFEVSLYKHIFINQNISRETLENKINDYLDITKDDYLESDYNNKINYFNEFYNIVDNATSFEEAKNQTLSYFNISEENINQYDNAIEGIKAGSLILRYNLNHIEENNNNNVYNYKLSNYDMCVFTIWSQNKGCTCVDDCLKVTHNNSDTENAIKRTPYGDNEYLSNVFSYIPSDSVVSMKLENGEWVTIKPHNLALDNQITK